MKNLADIQRDGWQSGINQVWWGDCVEAMRLIPDESVDLVLTDPPYGLGFMGKEWDSFKATRNTKNQVVTFLGAGMKSQTRAELLNFQVWTTDWAKECLRVLKPGGHLISFGGTRTYHRMACAVEDAGFEIRDMIEWIYNSGYPKSQNIRKMYDKKMGNERTTHSDITKGSSPYEGMGTALKPAHEPIVLARKPLSEKTIVENVLKHGTGGLDIDGCRIPMSKSEPDKRVRTDFVSNNDNASKNENDNQVPNKYYVQMYKGNGRFPANVVVTGDALNDGVIQKTKANLNYKYDKTNCGGNIFGNWGTYTPRNDSGSKSRYFDIDLWAEKNGILQFSKASKGEKNERCENLELKQKWLKGGGGTGISKSENIRQKNIHPTVKPLALMLWLVKLASKEGDLVCDPFGGSGTTVLACQKLGRNYILCEKEQEYCLIAESRLCLGGYGGNADKPQGGVKWGQEY